MCILIKSKGTDDQENKVIPDKNKSCKESNKYAPIENNNCRYFVRVP